MDRELRQLVYKILHCNPQLGHESLAAILVDEAQDKAPTTKGSESVFFQLAQEWILKHGTAPAFRRELRAFAKFVAKRHQ